MHYLKITARPTNGRQRVVYAHKGYAGWDIYTREIQGLAGLPDYLESVRMGHDDEEAMDLMKSIVWALVCEGYTVTTDIA